MITSVQLGQLIAALVGATAAGLFRWVDGVYDRKRRRESTLVAIVAEVGTICDLIRHQNYLEETRAMAADIRSGSWDGRSIVIDIRSNYFSVYEAMSADLALLKPKHIVRIVSFYAFCKSAIDSSRPDGPHVETEDEAGKSGNIVSLEGTLMAITELGAQITAFPKRPLPKVFDA